MKVTATIDETRALLDRARSSNRSVGLVPTMGYLHAGHESLMQRASSECDVVVATVFVNPLQFGAGEDLGAYPRDAERDSEVAERNGVDVLFMPSTAEMYPAPILTTVSVAEVTARFEGASRPTHFAGVATVVAKLFNIAGPCRAYFGEKDWQQLAVVRRMAADLSYPIAVVGCETVREPDGLALSSRNAYLSTEERAAAPVLQRALRAGAELVTGGLSNAAVVRQAVRSLIESEPTADVDYVAVVDADTLELFDPLRGTVRLLAAVRFGRARLIDNLGAESPLRA